MTSERFFIPRWSRLFFPAAFLALAFLCGCGDRAEDPANPSTSDTSEPADPVDVTADASETAEKDTVEMAEDDTTWVDTWEESNADTIEDPDVETTPDTNTIIEDTAEPPPAPLPTELGGDRPAAVYVPDNVEDKDDWPLVFLLHGYGSSGVGQNLYLGVSEHVTARGFILVVPNGTIDVTGKAFWNATFACCNFYGAEVDDDAYLDGLIDEAIATLPIDPERVSFFGHSNGGFMSFRMACNHADKIAAIADIAGATFNVAGYCNPTEPVSILHIHGTGDQTIPYEPNPYYPGALETVNQWLDNDGCDSTSSVEGEPINYDKWVPGAETTATTWSNCDQGSTISLWKMEATGHVPAFNEDFVPAVLDFLLSQSLLGDAL